MNLYMCRFVVQNNISLLLLVLLRFLLVLTIFKWHHTSSKLKSWFQLYVCRVKLPIKKHIFCFQDLKDIPYYKVPHICNLNEQWKHQIKEVEVLTVGGWFLYVEWDVNPRTKFLPNPKLQVFAYPSSLTKFSKY